MLPNFYFRYGTPEILDYYKRLADAAGLPVVVYANGLMNQNPVDFMREVMEIDGVIGVKYTIYDYFDMHRICELNGGDINVLNGPDEMLLCGLAMGADGLRVGLEDNLYMSKGVPATNVMQVERAVKLIKLANREVATAAQARELLSFPKR